MNKETKAMYEFILRSDIETAKLLALRDRYRNSRDFQNQLGYMIMGIMSTESKFFNINRNKVDLPGLVKEWF